MSITYMPLFGSYEKVFDLLTDEQVGSLVKGALHYFNSGDRVPLEPPFSAIYEMICQEIDRSRANYAEKSEKSREAARKRWDHADACERMQKKEKENENEKTMTKARGRAKRSTPADPASPNAPVPPSPAEETRAPAPAEAEKEKNTPKEETPERTGSFGNVLLTADQKERLRKEVPGWEDYVERLSAHMASTGKTYRDCAATILKWYREDLRSPAGLPRARPAPESPSRGSFDTDEFFGAALKRTREMLEARFGSDESTSAPSSSP